jgi:ABC-type polar amino acid transport system ATPase subunit
MTSDGPAPSGNGGPDTTALIEIEGLHKSYGAVEALKGVSLQIKRRDAQFIIGPSGCGKSTLLRCINLLEAADSGRMRIGDTRIQFGRRRIPIREQAHLRTHVGMVFQQFHLFPHMTSLQNVMEGPVTVLGVDRNEARDKADALLEKVGLAEKRDVYPRHLSGGQAQRVAIARALAQRPLAMLADEPVASLDPEAAQDIMRLLRRLAHHDGLAVLCVLHQVDLAFAYADRVVGMRDGRVAFDRKCADLSRDAVQRLYLAEAA